MCFSFCSVKFLLPEIFKNFSVNNAHILTIFGIKNTDVILGHERKRELICITILKPKVTFEKSMIGNGTVIEGTIKENVDIT